MGKETEYLQAEVAQAFSNFDNQLDAFFNAEDKKGLMAFLERYMAAFPTPADCIRSCFPEDRFRSTKELSSFLKEKYKEKRMRNVDVRKYEALAREKVDLEEMTPEQAEAFQQDCTESLAYFHSSEWRTGLDAKKGYQFLSRADTAANIRNVIFHLAFALDLSAETVSLLLTKGLLQQDFNPKDHREVIYWWCLQKKIPYELMIREHFVYYHSRTFEEDYQNHKIITEALKDTEYLTERLRKLLDLSRYGSDENMQRRAFRDYLRMIKVAETAEEAEGQKKKRVSEESPLDDEDTISLSRRTPRVLFWENFKQFPLETQRQGEPGETFDDIRKRKGKAVSENGKNPDRHYFRGDIRFRLEILEKLRKHCSLTNEEPLLPAPLLKELFDGIDYSEDVVINRCNGKAPISRNLLIATMFIGFFSDEAYIINKLPDELTVLEYFEETVSCDLNSCGLYPLYLRNPFELFISLCFLAKDPLAYFLSSWEHSFKA